MLARTRPLVGLRIKEKNVTKVSILPQDGFLYANAGGKNRP